MWLVQCDASLSAVTTPVAAVQRQYFAQHVFPDPISQARVSFSSFSSVSSVSPDACVNVEMLH
jgi:hypothetical protein